MTDTRDTSALLRAARDGDQDAFGQVLERHLPYVRRIAALNLGYQLAELVELEDLVQEAVVTALDSEPAEGHRSAATFRAWLSRVVENRIRSLGRWAARRRESAAEVGVASTVLTDSIFRDKTPTPSTRVSAQELEARLELALLKLREPERRVVVLRRIAGLEYADIAEQLGYASESSVRSIMTRALAKLSEFLSDLE